LLLLPFSPWLFVTVWPLAIAFFEIWTKAGLKGTWAGLLPPIALSVPVLFILTLFFKGQEPKWRAARAGNGSPIGVFLRTLILPALPLAAFLACVSLLLSMQDFLWPLVVTATSIDLAPVSIYLARIAGLYGQEPQLIAAANIGFELPVFVFFFLAFGLLQVFYLDRLALTNEKAKSE
jgi:ABC-type glycerol-3-phosphate transport system permease component